LKCHASEGEGAMEEIGMYIEFVVRKIFNNFVHEVPFPAFLKKKSLEFVFCDG
jgi:hypothetical protein